MSLTPTKTPLNEALAYQAIVEIARLMKDLQDPQKLEEAAKAAYGLPEAERKQAEEARKNLAVYRDKVAKAQACERSARATEEKNAQVLLLIEEEKKSLAALGYELGQKKTELDQRATELARLEATLSAKQKAQDERDAAIAERARAVEEREATANQLDAKIKQKATQFRELAGDL